MTRIAICCCGACALEIEGEPAINGVCHCADCKKRTGSAFGWSLYFADAQIVRRSGAFTRYEVATADAQRWFCARCGSTLCWKAGFLPTHTGVAAGCFADAAFSAPTFSASDAGRCAWVGLPSDWPAQP